MPEITPPPVETPVVPPVTPPADPPVVPDPPADPEPPAEPGVREKPVEITAPTVEIDTLDATKTKEYIDTSIKTAVSTLTEADHKRQVEKEVADVLAQNPEYKPYEKRIRDFVNHPNRSGLIKNGLPVSTVALEAVAPFLQKIGAEKARKADIEAKRTQDVGSSPRPQNTNTTPDYSKMSPAEITALNDKVKAGLVS